MHGSRFRISNSKCLLRQSTQCTRGIVSQVMNLPIELFFFEGGVFFLSWKNSAVLIFLGFTALDLGLSALTLRPALPKHRTVIPFLWKHVTHGSFHLGLQTPLPLRSPFPPPPPPLRRNLNLFPHAHAIQERTCTGACGLFTHKTIGALAQRGLLLFASFLRGCVLHKKSHAPPPGPRAISNRLEVIRYSQKRFWLVL